MPNKNPKKLANLSLQTYSCSFAAVFPHSSTRNGAIFSAEPPTQTKIPKKPRICHANFICVQLRPSSESVPNPKDQVDLIHSYFHH